MATKQTSFAGEVIHFGSTRFRVTGSGNLQLILHSLNEINNDTLAAIPMQGSTSLEPLVLANLTDQGAYLEFKTTNINETFTIHKIIIYIRVVGTGYPQ